MLAYIMAQRYQLQDHLNLLMTIFEKVTIKKYKK